MFNLLEKYLMKPMAKVSQIRLVRAITAAGMATIPFTIVGSMFLILSILPDVLPFLKPIFEATIFKITPLYMLAYKATMSLISLYFLIVTSYEYARIFNEEDKIDVNPLNATLLSVFGLFIMLPQLIIKDGAIALLHLPEEGIINGWAVGGDGLSRLAATGLFVAIIVAFITVRLYVFCVKRKLVIKMPDTVPDGVAKSFSALIPAFVIALVMFVISGGFTLLGTDLYSIVAIPFGFVINLTDSFLGIMVIYFLISTLWIVGIHGATIITSIILPINLSNLAANVANGSNYVWAGEFNNAYVTVGGSGATLGLIVMMTFLAKSDQLKMLGRASITPAIFNINEPVLFGLPLVYNPFMAVPFFLAPMASAGIAYVAIKLHLVAPMIVQAPWPTPIGIGAFIGSGDPKAIILAIVCVLVASIIYFPFFKYYDKKLRKEELANK